MTKQKILYSALLTGGLTALVVFLDPTGRIWTSVEPVGDFCDFAECPVCEVEDLNPAIPDCPTDTGWLCCDDALTVCGPAVMDDTCQGMYYYCEYYEVGPDGDVVCFDEFGQGLVAEEAGDDKGLQAETGTGT